MVMARKTSTGTPDVNKSISDLRLLVPEAWRRWVPMSAGGVDVDAVVGEEATCREFKI